MRPTRLQSAVRRALRALGVPRPGETVVAALSGGADSVAMLDALRALAARDGFRVVAAHLDHGLREGSPDDAAFCAELCAGMGVALRTGRRDVRARARADKEGTEAAARAERHAFLHEVREAEGASAIAVAHTLDDQAETVLLRLLRGAGSLGLGAMRPRSGALIRPLLEVSRADVVAHLQARGLAWREDPTNADLAVLRNRVRQELVPYLEARFNPGVREALSRTASVLADEADALAVLAGDGGMRREGATVTLPRAALAGPLGVARVRVRQALSAAGGLHGVTRVHVDRVIALARRAHASGRRVALPGRREAVAHFDEIRFGSAGRGGDQAPFSLPLSVPGEVTLPGGARLVARPAAGPAVAGAEGHVVAAPAGPLEVRTRHADDRVRGHGGEISLRRFLMDRRVPAAERDGVPVVAAGRRVVWIAGLPAPAPAAEDRYVRLSLVPPRPGATA